jgi:hypothetical protein
VTVEETANGGRRVYFYVLQRLTGREVSNVTIKPCQLDHLMRWRDGQIESSLSLLAQLTGLSELELRQITFPDAERLLNAFLEVLPSTIRDDIESGRNPAGAASMPDFSEPIEPQPEYPPETPPMPSRNGDPSFTDAQREALAMAGAEDDDDESTGFDDRL